MGEGCYGMTKEDELAREAREFLAKRLIEIRKALGLTSTEFASKAGINYVLYRQYEKGQRSPTYINLYRLVRRLNINPATLFFEPEEIETVSS